MYNLLNFLLRFSNSYAHCVAYSKGSVPMSSEVWTFHVFFLISS